MKDSEIETKQVGQRHKRRLMEEKKTWQYFYVCLPLLFPLFFQFILLHGSPYCPIEYTYVLYGLSHAHQQTYTRVIHTHITKQTYSPIHGQHWKRDTQTHTCTSNINSNNGGNGNGSSSINRVHKCMDKSTPYKERSIKRMRHSSPLCLYIRSEWAEYCRHQYDNEEEEEEEEESEKKIYFVRKHQNQNHCVYRTAFCCRLVSRSICCRSLRRSHKRKLNCCCCSSSSWTTKKYHNKLSTHPAHSTRESDVLHAHREGGSRYIESVRRKCVRECVCFIGLRILSLKTDGDWKYSEQIECERTSITEEKTVKWK